MSLPEIRKVYEKRYVEMTEMLKDDRRKLSPERQHQIYGAVIEIKSFLENIRKFEDAQKNDDNIGTFLDVQEPKNCGAWTPGKLSLRMNFLSFMDSFKKKR